MNNVNICTHGGCLIATSMCRCPRDRFRAFSYRKKEEDLLEFTVNSWSSSSTSLVFVFRFRFRFNHLLNAFPTWPLVNCRLPFKVFLLLILPSTYSVGQPYSAFPKYFDWFVRDFQSGTQFLLRMFRVQRTNAE